MEIIRIISIAFIALFLYMFVKEKKSDSTVALRVPGDKWLCDVISMCKTAIYSTSANRSGFPCKTKVSELEKEFDIHRISSAPGCYDIKKLEWFNAHYIKEMDDERYLDWIKPFLKYDISDKSEDWVRMLLLTYKTHINCGEMINDVVKNFFFEGYELDDECKAFLASDDIIPVVIDTFAREIEAIEDFTTDNINIAIDNVKTSLNVKGKLLYMPLRIKASGFMHGPELDACIYLLGKEKTLKNLRR